MAPARKKGAHKTKSGSKLQLGDLVLAKVKGFPAWPAKVLFSHSLFFENFLNTFKPNLGRKRSNLKPKKSNLRLKRPISRLNSI